VLGEVVVAEAVQALVEHGLGEGVALQWQGAPAQPPQDGCAGGQQAVVPDLVPVRAQRPENLVEVGQLDDGHRHDHVTVVMAEHQVEYLAGALPPGGDVLEVTTQLAGHHPAQAKAQLLGVAHDAARQSPLDLMGGVGLPPSERPVDPQEHALDHTPATPSGKAQPRITRSVPPTHTTLTSASLRAGMPGQSRSRLGAQFRPPQAKEQQVSVMGRPKVHDCEPSQEATASCLG
jgi:hypothetical protein